MKGAKTHIVLAILLLSAFANAQTLTGTVKNSTTGKPASGDEVVLIKLGAGMEEVAHTETDPRATSRSSWTTAKARTWCAPYIRVSPIITWPRPEARR